MKQLVVFLQLLLLYSWAFSQEMDNATKPSQANPVTIGVVRNLNFVIMAACAVVTMLAGALCCMAATVCCNRRFANQARRELLRGRSTSDEQSIVGSDHIEFSPPAAINYADEEQE